MSNDHTLRLGGGAGGEDDLRDVVAINGDRRDRAVRVPIDVAHLPDRHRFGIDVLSGQHDLAWTMARIRSANSREERKSMGTAMAPASWMPQ